MFGCCFHSNSVGIKASTSTDFDRMGNSSRVDVHTCLTYAQLGTMAPQPHIHHPPLAAYWQQQPAYRQDLVRYLAKHKAHASVNGLQMTYWRTSSDGKELAWPSLWTSKRGWIPFGVKSLQHTCAPGKTTQRTFTQTSCDLFVPLTSETKLVSLKCNAPGVEFCCRSHSSAASNVAPPAV